MKKFKKIYIEITNVCNKNCSFCSVDERTKKFMNVEEFKHILNEIKDHTNYIYLHIKGEPLMHPNIKDILQLCTNYNILVNITTNGTLIKEKSEILREFPCVRQINISLHSFEAQDNKNYIDSIMAGATKIRSKSDVIIVYRFWALKDNKLTEENNQLLNALISYYNLDLEIIEKIRSDANIKIGNNLYINKAPLFRWPSLNDEIVGDYGFCYGMSRQIGILVDGTVVPCCLDSSGCINLGNIFETSMDDILSSQHVQKLLKDFRNGQVNENLCKRCQYRLRFKRNVV